MPEASAKVKLSALLGLPKTERGAGRVGDHAELSSPLHLSNVLDELGTQGLRFLRCRLDVIDVHVWYPHRGGAGHRVLHQPATRTFTHPDHSVGHVPHIHVFELPIEQLAIERLGLADVGRQQLNVNEGISHKLPPAEPLGPPSFGRTLGRYEGSIGGANPQAAVTSRQAEPQPRGLLEKRLDPAVWRSSPPEQT